MSHYHNDPEPNNLICEAVGCHAKGTDEIAVNVGTLGVISLLLCTDCISKFQETAQT
jgi:hypothetical protein